MFVLATAGHVDHGKSTLLKALTGMEPDRLPEEKKRGLTINLNFLWTDFEGTGRVGFIDVPGHHKFVGNMITGVSEASGYILVVAADDGWMPQTDEHLLILKAFNIQNGILVITKTDLSSSDEINELRTESLKKTETTLGKKPEAFFFSKDQSNDVQLIREGMKRLFKGLSKPMSQSSARVWVDRAFVPKGLGVVITGTLTEGPLQQGQTLFLWPANQKTEVRSIQSYSVAKAAIGPTSRVALQLSGISRNEVGVGSLLDSQEMGLSQRIDSQITYLKMPVRKNTQAKFYFGTLEEDCLIIPVKEGNPSIARILFKRPVPVRFGDRFVIRAHGEEFLLASGWIADPKARSKSHRALIDLLSNSELSLSFHLRVETKLEGVLCLANIIRWSLFDTLSIQSQLESPRFKLIAQDAYVEKAALEDFRDRIVALLGNKSAINKREIQRTLTKCFSAFFIDLALNFGTAEKWWEIHGEQVATVHKNTAMTDLEKKLLEFIASPPQIWEREEILRRGFAKDSLQRLVKMGELVNLKDGLFTHHGFYKDLEEKVKVFLLEKGKASTAELKPVLGGVSRKYAIPLLEKMDENRLTYLKNGVRQLLK